jgi:hypothetical protein
MQGQLREARNQLTDLSDEVAKEIFDINDVQQECRMLQSQIVQSPERIKREIGTIRFCDASAVVFTHCATAACVCLRSLLGLSFLLRVRFARFSYDGCTG